MESDKEMINIKHKKIECRRYTNKAGEPGEPSRRHGIKFSIIIHHDGWDSFHFHGLYSQPAIVCSDSGSVPGSHVLERRRLLDKCEQKHCARKIKGYRWWQTITSFQEALNWTCCPNKGPITWNYYCDVFFCFKWVKVSRLSVDGLIGSEMKSCNTILIPVNVLPHFYKYFPLIFFCLEGAWLRYIGYDTWYTFCSRVLVFLEITIKWITTDFFFCEFSEFLDLVL